MKKEKPSQLYRELVEENYPTIQYQFVEMLTEHLADCSRTFKGDLQQSIILALIGQVHIEHYRKNSGDVTNVKGISTSRLSDLTGIPRQTVRRKLAALAKLGWIEPTTLGSWRIMARDGVSKAGVDLADLNNRNLDRIARFLSAMAPFFKLSDETKSVKK